MENYFQAEAFNLDKVLDEFEQNEGEPLPLLPSASAALNAGWVAPQGNEVLGRLWLGGSYAC